MEISFTIKMEGKSKYVHTVEVQIVLVLGLKFLVVTDTSHCSIFTSYHCASPVLYVPRGTDSQSLGSKPLGPFAFTFFLA